MISDPRMQVFRQESLASRLRHLLINNGHPRWWVAAGIVGLVWLLILMALRFSPQTGATIQMQLQSDLAGSAQWYFDQGSGYSESASVTGALHVGENDLTFRLPTGTYRSLRFDPINNDGHVKIESLRWDTSSTVDTSALGQEKLVPLANIARITNAGDGIDVWPVHGSDDPQTQLVLSEPLNLTSPIRPLRDDLIGSFELTCGLLLMVWIVCTQLVFQRLVIAGMGLSAGLILAMALISTTRGSVHPDEFTHLGAYQYYVDHWLPPAVDDPATNQATSVWGGSYLSELDVVYDLAARSTAQLRAWTPDNLHAARLFQFGLWLILCILALCRRRWAWVLSVVLLSPQIWYVFSYFNADALPLLLSLIAAGLIVDTDNGLHRFLETGDSRGPAMWVAAVCLGLLLVSKRNYLPVVPAFVLWLAVLHLGLGSRAVVAILGGLLLVGTATFIGQVPAMAAWHVSLMFAGCLLVATTVGCLLWNYWKDIHARKVLLHLVGFVVICVAIAVPRLAWDVKVNGWLGQKSTRIEAVVEARAGAGFKPSDIAAGRGEASIALAARGVSLNDVIFAPYHWMDISIASAFGVYGYMNVFAPAWLYICLFVLTLAIFAIAVYTIRRSYPHQWVALTSIVLGGSTLVIASSLLLSWVNAFQPQGRYLLPMAVMLALMLGHSAPNLPKRIFSCLVCAAFVLSAFSFAFVALPALIRIG